jgi:phosphoserine aminotransferase
MKKTYFTAGPAEMFPSFEQHLRSAVEEQIGSISHRSQQFRNIYQHTADNLRILMNIPASHGIYFTSSASEVWERIALNLVEKESFHLVNGSFSTKFHEYTAAVGKNAIALKKPMGEGFDAAEIIVPADAEIICTTQNETSTGVQMHIDDIHALKRANPDKLLAVDMVSSAPYPDLDFSLVDTAFFSVQKAFGLPAGLGVWIANEACLEKSKKIQKTEGLHIGGHHSLPVLWKNFQTFETPATPNVLGIYLLGKVAEDMNKIGIANLRKTTEHNADLLYDFFRKHDAYSVGVQTKKHRSQTVAVANTVVPSADVIKKVKESGMIIGAGYGAGKDSQIRVANFPATSTEQIEALIHVMGDL